MTRKLRAVGYWCSDLEMHLPHPQKLAEKLESAERPSMLAYLRAGKTYVQWRGFSYCRFECGIDDREMGSRCLTDGLWVWPEGLHHYVACHDVLLPEEFIGTMRRRHWEIPQDDLTLTLESHGDPDYTFWIVWGQRHAR